MSKSQPIAIPRRTPATWTPDDRVTQCFGCRKEFSMWVRKHHCRVCGRIFCHECSSQRVRVPSFIRHFIASSVDGPPEDNTKRVCQVCFNSTVVANDNKDLIYILANLPLCMVDFLHLMFVCKAWNGSIQTLLALWNSIQYKLPHTKFTKLEKALLVNRLPEVMGHSAWAVQIVKALGIVPGHKGEDRLDCKHLLCRAGCRTKLEVYDLLELYTHNKNLSVEIDQWVAGAWHHIDSQDHIHLMPWWINIFRSRPHIAIYKFIHAIKLDEDVIFAFFFELQLQSKSTEYQTSCLHILNTCLKEVDEDIRLEWNKSNDFINFLTKVASCEMEARRQRLLTDYIIQNGDNLNIKCPWDIEYIIQRIDFDFVKLNTASKPLKISLYTQKGTMDILFKFEDVRKDRMTMDITYWLEKCTAGKVNFTRYNVFPISNRTGIIQMLDGVTTLYDVKHKHNTTLQNFILDRNSDMSVDALRTKFVKSVAAACVLSYVIGVGDRHLENMLVTDDGKLIHVDFSYLLGDDPKHVKTEMRITPDMLDALGGTNSSTFTQFQELCADVYKILREKSSFWYCLLVYLTDATPRIGNFWGQRFRVQQHVLERLCPGELDNEAAMQIVEIVKRNSKDTWGQTLTDSAHGLANSLKSYTGIFNLEL